MAKRIYPENVLNWANKNKGKLGLAVGTPIAFLIFYYLALSGAITITGVTWTETCAGTPEEPCLAVINFTANEDVFLYKGSFTELFGLNETLKQVKLYRTWGTSWREIKQEGCTGSWCGCSYCTASNPSTFIYAFRKGSSYTIKIEALKFSPKDNVKWSFGIPKTDESYIDPVWKGYKTDDFFTELKMNYVSIGTGIAIYDFKNPTTFNIILDKNKLATLFYRYKGSNINSWNIEIFTNRTIKTMREIYDISCHEEPIWNGTETICKEIITGWYWDEKIIEYEPFTSVVVMPNETKTFKLTATWTPHLGEQSIEWLPKANVIGTDFVQSKWGWWNDTYDYCRNLTFTDTVGYNISVPKDIYFDSSDWTNKPYNNSVRIVSAGCNVGGSEVFSQVWNTSGAVDALDGFNTIFILNRTRLTTTDNVTVWSVYYHTSAKEIPIYPTAMTFRTVAGVGYILENFGYLNLANVTLNSTRGSFYYLRYNGIKFDRDDYLNANNGQHFGTFGNATTYAVSNANADSCSFIVNGTLAVYMSCIKGSVVWQARVYHIGLMERKIVVSPTSTWSIESNGYMHPNATAATAVQLYPINGTNPPAEQTSVIHGAVDLNKSYSIWSYMRKSSGGNPSLLYAVSPTISRIDELYVDRDGSGYARQQFGYDSAARIPANTPLSYYGEFTFPSSSTDYSRGQQLSLSLGYPETFVLGPEETLFIPICSLTGATNITYDGSTATTLDCIGPTCTLLWNGTNVSDGRTPDYNGSAIVFPAGTVNLTCYAAGTVNQTWFKIDKGTATLKLAFNGTEADKTYDSGTAMNATGWVSSPAGITWYGTLYKNSSYIFDSGLVNETYTSTSGWNASISGGTLDIKADGSDPIQFVRNATPIVGQFKGFHFLFTITNNSACSAGYCDLNFYFNNVTAGGITVGGIMFDLIYSNPNNDIRLEYSGVSSSCNSTPPAFWGRWYEVNITIYDNKTVRAYVNGSSSCSITLNDTDVAIKQITLQTNKYLTTAKLDDFGIYGSVDQTTLPIGVYNYSMNLTHQNYTGYISRLATFRPPQTCVIATTPNITYATASSNVTCYSTTGIVCTLLKNGTDVSTGKPLVYNNSVFVYTADSYNFTCNNTAEQVQNTSMLVIDREVPTCTVAPLDSTITYGKTIQAFCEYSNKQGNCNLWKNVTDDVTFTNITTINNTAIIYSAGKIIFESNASATQNYTSCTVSANHTILKGNVSHTVSPATSTITYVTSITHLCTSNTSQAPCTLWLNSTNITAKNNTAVTYGAGSLTLKSNSTGNANFTANSTGASSTITINKGSTSCTVSPTTQTITYGASVLQRCTSNTSQAPCSLWRNVTNITTTNNTNVVYGAGQVNFKSNNTQVANYSACTASTSTLTVNKDTTTIYLALNGTQGNKNYVIDSIINATAWKTVNNGNLSLLRNGTIFNSTLTLNAISNMSSSSTPQSFNFTAVLYDHANYTAAQVERIARVVNISIAVNMPEQKIRAFVAGVADSSQTGGDGYWAKNFLMTSGGMFYNPAGTSIINYPRNLWLKFNITNLTYFDYASLNAYQIQCLGVFSGQNCNSTFPCVTEVFYSTNQTWSDTLLTYNTQPEWDPYIVDGKNFTTNGTGWVNWNVTNHLYSILSNSTFMIRIPTINITSKSMNFTGNQSAYPQNETQPYISARVTKYLINETSCAGPNCYQNGTFIPKGQANAQWIFNVTNIGDTAINISARWNATLPSCMTHYLSINYTLEKTADFNVSNVTWTRMITNMQPNANQTYWGFFVLNNCTAGVTTNASLVWNSSVVS